MAVALVEAQIHIADSFAGYVPVAIVVVDLGMVACIADSIVGH